MAIKEVSGGSENVRTQNVRADRQAEEARTQNERRQAEAAKNEETRRPKETNRGQNTDITA